MAVIGRLGNPDIEYGNPTDVRMKNGDSDTSRPILIGGYPTPPKKIVATARPKYRDKDKQAAYEKAIAQGIKWTGQYTKNETTGEVIPKPLEELLDEAKAKIDGVVEEPNLLKKYWWVLAAVGVYLIISKD